LGSVLQSELLFVVVSLETRFFGDLVVINDRNSKGKIPEILIGASISIFEICEFKVCGLEDLGIGL
jgi:hypothetical protein